MKDTSHKNKVLSIIGIIMCIIFAPILILNIILISKSFINKSEVPSFAGYLPMIVMTGSMEPEIMGGDLIICKTAEAEDISKGDVISFFDPEGSGTSVVTHRVTEVINEDGEISFRTKGDANLIEDKTAVPAKNLVGVYKTRIPYAGNVSMFMQSTAGLIVCVILPILLFLGIDIFRSKRFEKNKSSETEALRAELETLKKQVSEKKKNDNT